jgi:hypothetical protein
MNLGIIDDRGRRKAQWSARADPGPRNSLGPVPPLAELLPDGVDASG